MNRHELGLEAGTLTPGGCVMTSSCWCGFPLAASARTVRKAQRRLWRRMKEHRGFALAAGPGWTG